MKYEGWKNIPTIQFKEIISELVEAKEDQKAIMMIAPTGSGKSNAIKAYTAKNNKHVYVITMGDTHNLKTLLNEMCQVLGEATLSLRNKELKYYQLRRIKNKLIEISNSGGKPIFILDEAENAKIGVLKALKELYDGVIDYCSLVLIGTDQLIHSLNKKSNGQSIPQLRRRFKAGTRFITPVNKEKDFQPFFDTYIPKLQDLQDLLISLCDNYGELHDYLDPVLKKCAKKGVPLTEEFFRLFHKLPKRK